MLPSRSGSRIFGLSPALVASRALRNQTDLCNLVVEFGKIRLVFEMVDFHGWHAGAFWEDMKFDLRHFADIERLALVGETRWQKAMGIFCKPFTKAEIKYFDLNDIDEAYAWIRAGLEETAIS